MLRRYAKAGVLLAIIGAVVILLAPAVLSQESGKEESQPPGNFQEYATESGPGNAGPELAGCDCSTTGWDSDCHYEFVPAMECTVEYDDAYWSIDYSGSDFGVKVNTHSSVYVYCNIPTDWGNSADNDYGDPDSVRGFFYNATSGEYAYLYVYSSSQTGSSDYEYGTSSFSGQRTIQVDDLISDISENIFWYVMVRVQTEPGSAFHGISVCYDQD